ncbi:MAG: hypothetical protein PVH61_00045 [Candidatus Aminicenantes bacterium]
MSLHKIWFPQIESRGSQDKEDIVVETLRKFYELFGISTDEVFVAKNPLTKIHNTEQGIKPDIFNLSAILKFLKEKKSIWTFGTFSPEQVEECSLQELGFNLFNLPGKMFNYVSIIPSPDDDVIFSKKRFTFKIKNVNSNIYNDAIELLKWSMCKKACLEIQKSFGHGQRDHFQGQSYEGLLTELAHLNINNEEKWSWSDLPCPKECRVFQRIKQIMEECQKKTNKDEKCPELAREIALMDCQEYRMAQSKYFSNLYRSTISEVDEKFKKIIILEDNQAFRKQLKNDLRQYVKKVKDIIEADPKKSWQNYCLSKKKRKDILGKIFEDETIVHGEILTCFDLELGKKNIPKTADGYFMKNIFGGQWILYKTVCEYPRLPRLVITGYRSQDFLSYIAGGTAFLMKPYTEQLLLEQIKKARQSARRGVTWLCPENVQKNYSNLLVPSVLSFADIRDLLKNWLDSKQVDLNIVESLENIDDEEFVIIDIFEIGLEHEHLKKKKEITEIIYHIRAKNPDVQFILVLPFDLVGEIAVSDYYTQLPFNFHEGTDKVIRKPFWFVLDGKTNPDECLGNMILEQLAYKGNFDVKYQVLVPLAPIVGRLSKRIKDILGNPEKKAKDELYAPLLPYLINAFGLSGRISDIADLRNDVKTKLSEKIKDEKLKDEKRWENIPTPDESISKILDGFLDALKSSKFIRYITLESWLRHIVDKKPSIIFNGQDRKDIHSLIEPLARVFGGSTRYEFSVRGSWYKGEKRIDDILIVVEFCAKSSIIGRKFIRETAVKYLSKIAGEDVVLVQEIPIKGFMWE